MFNRGKVNTNDTDFERSYNHHLKIKLTIELNTKKFLYTNLICINGIHNTLINKRSTKLLIAWLSEVRKCYKHSVIIGDLHQSKRI